MSNFGQLWSYGHFLIPVHALVWTAIRNQLVGHVLNLVAYRLCCKHYFCHLTHPSSYRQSSFRISTPGRYLRNAGNVGWVGIPQASVYCMTLLTVTEVFLNLTEVFLTLTEVFPCFFLTCKPNARVKLAKTGHGPHSSTLVCICVVRLLFVLFYVVFVCKCVLPPGDNPIAVNKYIISCWIFFVN